MPSRFGFFVDFGIGCGEADLCVVGFEWREGEDCGRQGPGEVDVCSSSIY